MYAMAPSSAPYGWQPLQPQWGLGASTAPISTQVESAAASTLASVAAFTGPAAPFVLAAAAIAGLLAALGVGAGCGQACIQATNLVNQAEPVLLKNIQNYFALPAPRAASVQAAALSCFDQIWQSVQTGCAAIPGTPGKSCVSDRQSGACTWKQTATSPLLAFPGEPQPGACWNWFLGYRDPIANDPDVVSDENAAVSSVSSAAGSVSSALSSVTSSSLFIPGLVVAGLVVVYMVTK